MSRTCADFVAAVDPHLGERYRFAENAWHDVPSYCLAELRGFAERFVELVLGQAKERAPKNLADGLERLAARSLAPPHVRHDLDKLRIRGNRAVHRASGEPPPEPQESGATLEIAHGLAVWLFRQGGGLEAEVVRFQRPPAEAPEPVFRKAVLEHDAQACFQVAITLLDRADRELKESLDRSGVAFIGREPEVVDWLKKAVNKVPAARSKLARLCLEGRGIERDPAQAIELYEWAAHDGDAEAHGQLGVFHLAGEHDCPLDVDKARHHLELGAEGDDLDAFNGLVAIYAEGKGVSKDPAKALAYATKAAEAGHPLAQRNLGLFYERGNGAAPDPERALVLYRKAADAGVPVAMFDLARCYLEGIGSAVDDAEGVRWLERAATRGMPAAMYHLGVALRQGKGVARNLARAAREFSAVGVASEPVETELAQAAAEAARETILELRKAMMAGNPQPGGADFKDAILVSMCADAAGNPIPDMGERVTKVFVEGVSSPESLFSALRELNPAGLPERPAAPRIAAVPARAVPKVGRNEPCWCGSGQKFKRCHGSSSGI